MHDQQMVGGGDDLSAAGDGFIEAFSDALHAREILSGLRLIHQKYRPFVDGKGKERRAQNLAVRRKDAARLEDHFAHVGRIVVGVVRIHRFRVKAVHRCVVRVFDPALAATARSLLFG